MYIKIKEYMKILTLQYYNQLNNKKYGITQNNNVDNYVQNLMYKQISSDSDDKISIYKSKNIKMQELSLYNINFKSSYITDDRMLHALLKYNIPDLYSKRILLSSEILQNVLRKKIFSKQIGEIVQIMMPYKKCLDGVEKEIFNIIVATAKKNPKKTLEKTLIDLLPEHSKKLEKTQRKIFKNILFLSKDLPEEIQNEIQDLIEASEIKILKKAQVYKFNSEDFKYKLQRIKEGIDCRNIRKERKAIDTLIEMANPLEEFMSEQTKHVSTKQINHNIKVKNINIIREMHNYLMKSPLNEDKELNQLLQTSIEQLYAIPVKINFGRKVFIKNLRSILENVNDTEIKKRIAQAANQIPTSHNSISAFIVKYAFSSNEKIGYSIFFPSVGTIEHLHPTKTGGSNCLYNKGLASRITNSMRGHMSFEQQLKLIPEIPIYAQRQIDQLIELTNKGVFEEILLPRGYIKNYADRLRKISNGKVNVDISKLEI